MVGQEVTGEQGKSFTVVREIGRGGFGVVYLAEDAQGQQYALKVISPVSDDDVRLSFEREIQSTLELDHENILKIVDYGSCTVGSEEGLFAASEYCTDGDYRGILSGYGTGVTNFDGILNDIRQVGRGLEVLHTKAIHRDLKPENIFISAGKLKIGDFGLSKFVDQATRTLTFKGYGTHRYMAPEVWLNRHATAATDLYAVGIMLYEALTGEAPFSSPDVNALREMHIYLPAPRPKSINAAVPEHLDGVVKRLLAKEPSERYQTASELLEVLGHTPRSANPSVANLAARLRRHQDASEAERLELERAELAQQDSFSRNRYKEQEVLALHDEVIEEVNQQLQETQIVILESHGGRRYQFGNRVLGVHFFAADEMYANPEVPGRMTTLRNRHVVHGGYIEVKEDGQDREGWNLVLVRPTESMYGEWRIVETRLSAMAGRRAQHEPFATEAGLFADNLACHWMPAMHIFVLKDKLLERSDIVKILDVFIPQN